MPHAQVPVCGTDGCPGSSAAAEPGSLIGRRSVHSAEWSTQVGEFPTVESIFAGLACGAICLVAPGWEAVCVVAARGARSGGRQGGHQRLPAVLVLVGSSAGVCPFVGAVTALLFVGWRAGVPLAAGVYSAVPWRHRVA